MSMEYVKLTFALTRGDAYALACVAEQCGMSVPLTVRKIVQAELRRREEALHAPESATHGESTGTHETKD